MYAELMYTRCTLTGRNYFLADIKQRCKIYSSVGSENQNAYARIHAVQFL